MITGRVENRHALIAIIFRLPGQPDMAIECVIDTGFTDALCLPPTAVAAMGLPYKFDFPASLADGSLVHLPVHEAIIVLGEAERRVHLLATGERPLVGTVLMDGMELVVQFKESGIVTLEPL